MLICPVLITVKQLNIIYISHLADAIIQSNLQMSPEYIIYFYFIRFIRFQFEYILKLIIFFDHHSSSLQSHILQKSL